jgi:hypothetical protein
MQPILQIFSSLLLTIIVASSAAWPPWVYLIHLWPKGIEIVFLIGEMVMQLWEVVHDAGASSEGSYSTPLLPQLFVGFHIARWPHCNTPLNAE